MVIDSAVRSYRSVVISTTACPACGAETGERCRKLPGGWTPGTGKLVDYVHDDRSCQHYLDSTVKLIRAAFPEDVSSS